MFGTSNQEIHRIPQCRFHKAAVKHLFLGHLETLNLLNQKYISCCGDCAHTCTSWVFYMWWSWPKQNKIRIVFLPFCISHLTTWSPVWCQWWFLIHCTWDQNFISSSLFYISRLINWIQPDDLETVCELWKMLLLLRAAIQLPVGLSSLSGPVYSKTLLIHLKSFDEHQLNWESRSSLMNQFWKF